MTARSRRRSERREYRPAVGHQAGADVGVAGNFGAAAAPSETANAITRQPAPEFSNDLNTADILIETLIAWGATHVFGVVGDGINSLIEALRRRQDRIRYIGVRHEEAAAFMASGYAKHTGRVSASVPRDLAPFIC